MNLKENIDYIKKEIGIEEKFLENFVKLERIYKKYKVIIILSIIIFIVIFSYFKIEENINNEKKVKANIAYNLLLKDSNNTVALNQLKENNINLYEIFVFLNSKNHNININTPYFKELAIYKNALENNNIKELENVLISSDFLLKDYAFFNKALLEAKNENFEASKKTLKQILPTSSISNIANWLRHYLISK